MKEKKNDIILSGIIFFINLIVFTIVPFINYRLSINYIYSGLIHNIIGLNMRPKDMNSILIGVFTSLLIAYLSFNIFKLFTNKIYKIILFIIVFLMSLPLLTLQDV